MALSESDPPRIPAPLLATAPPPPSPVLVGALGLRAGWSILLYLAIAALLAVTLYLGLATATGQLDALQQARAVATQEKERAERTHTRPPVHALRVSPALIGEGSMTAAELLAALGLSFLERRRFRVYGTGLRHVRDLLPGAFWGLAAMGILIGSLRMLHLLVFDGQLQHGAAAASYGGAWLAMFFLVGLSEEFLFRGYLQFTLRRGMLGLARRWAPGRPQEAAYLLSGIVTSLLFFLVHTANPGENPFGLAGVFLAGILFCYALWRTGSLWWGIGFHMTWDWAQSFLFGVPDSGGVSAGRLFATHAAGNSLLSGGSDGPEGSLLLGPVLLLVILVLRLHPRTAQPALEPESIPGVPHVSAPEAIA